MMQEGTLRPRKAPLAGRFLLIFSQTLAGLGSLSLLASWLAPNHYPPWTSFHGEAAAFAALCFFVLARLTQPAPLVWRPFPWLLALPVVIIGAQVLTRQIWYGGDALLSVMYLLGAVFAFALGVNTHAQRKPDPLSWLAIIVVAASVASVFIAALQWQRLELSLGIFSAERGPDMRIYSNLGQPNHLATLLLTGLVLAWWLRIEQLLVSWRFWGVTLWLSIGLVLTESRSGLIGAIAVGIVLLARRRHLPRARRVVIGWWAFLIAGHALLTPLNNALFLDPVRTQQLGDDNQRFVMWRQVLSAIADHPWLGSGWRQTMLALKAAALRTPGRLATDYAHNFELDLFVWVGVPLGAALLLAGAWWLARTWWRIADARQLLLFAATVPFLVHAQFEFPFAYSYFLFPAAWMWGVLAASQAPAPSVGANDSWRIRAFALLLCTAFSALSVAIAAEYMQAEEDYRVMRFELRRVGHVPVGYEAPHLVLLTQLRELLALGRVRPAQGMSPELLARLGAASARNGWATLDLTYATALALNGQPREAERQLALLGFVYGQESAAQAYGMFRAFQVAHPELASIPVPQSGGNGRLR